MITESMFKHATVFLLLIRKCLFFNVCFFCQQYSEKEDKYEEEIKILTDKLKEVRMFSCDRMTGHAS